MVRGLALLAFAAGGTGARAQEAAELFAQPTEYTDVADAFDGPDLIDVQLSLGFTSFTETAVIQREQGTSPGGGGTALARFAAAEQVEKRMWMLAELGVYQDLMVFVRVPFVLEQQQLLTPTALARESGLLEDPEDEAGQWSSRVRDGVPNVTLGVAWGPLNQFRHPGLPTLVLRASAQVATGEALVPCLDGQGCFRGAGRGTVALLGETRFSYRYRYFEPYCGVAFGRELVTTGSDNFLPAGKVPGDLDAAPPTRAGLTAGLAFIPWEAKGRFQRLTLDARLSAAYVSRGRDYTALYDVLGSSTHPELLVTQDPWFTHLDPTPVPFTGMTTVDAHARLIGDVSLRIQAARYVRFQLGVFAAFATPHLMTGAHPCNGGLITENGQVRCASGPPNPSFRSAIDRPGQRFRIEDVFRLGTTIAATGTF